MKKVIIVGYSGHSYVVIEALQKLGHTIKGYMDKQEAINNPYGLEYLGLEGDANLKELSAHHSFALGIGDNLIRSNVAEKVTKNGGELVSMIHPKTEISETAKIGEGSFVSSGVLVNAFVEIGSWSIVNTGAIIEHECVIKNGVHVAPHATLLGNVQVGERSFVGAGSVIKQGISLGSGVIIGAGSVVINDIEEPGTYAGSPARKISKQ